MKILIMGPPSTGVTFICKILGLKLSELDKRVALVDFKGESSDLLYMLGSKNGRDGSCIPYGNIDCYFDSSYSETDYDYVVCEVPMTFRDVDTTAYDMTFVVTDLDNKNIVMAQNMFEYNWHDKSALIINQILDVRVREERIIEAFGSPENILHVPFDLKTKEVDMSNAHYGTLSYKGYHKEILKSVEMILEFIDPDIYAVANQKKKAIFKWRKSQ